LGNIGGKKKGWKEEERKFALKISINHATSALPHIAVILQGAPAAANGLRQGIDALG